MSYEVSQITDTPSAIPSQSTPQMREPKEIDPYKASKNISIAQEALNNKATDQKDINSGTEAVAGESVPASNTEETVTLSPQVAALARKEQKFRQKELEIKKREEALAAEKAEIAQLKELKTKLANKDYSGIEELVKYDEYTQYLIDKDSNLSPEQQALKKLEADIEGVKSAQKEDIAKRFDAAVNERRKAVKELVDTKSEFQRIKKANAEEAVVQHILDTWEHDSIDLSPEEAAKEVEALLLEKAQKWKALLEEEKEAAPVVDDSKKQLPPLKPQVKTLTNNMAATGEIKRQLKPLHQMSESERYAEARRRAEEKLKQGIR